MTTLVWNDSAAFLTKRLRSPLRRFAVNAWRFTVNVLRIL